MAELFKPGGSLWGAKGTGLKYTEAQRLRARLNAEKAEVLTGDLVEINLDAATLTDAEGSYLLPVAFVEKLRMAKRQGASPQQPLELIDGPLEAKALNYNHSTEPIYWLHAPGNYSIEDCNGPIQQMPIDSWPVYGYGADYGMGYHVTPIIKQAELPGWKDCEWLCRCAQCGRELPPSYFFLNTSGRLKGICKACTSTNRIVDKVYHRPMRYRNEDERKLLVDTRYWYEGLWHRNLCPRGDYANWCLGEAEIQERMRLATRHKRGSAPRRPPATISAKIKEIYALMEETQGYV